MGLQEALGAVVGFLGQRQAGDVFLVDEGGVVDDQALAHAESVEGVGVVGIGTGDLGAGLSFFLSSVRRRSAAKNSASRIPRRLSSENRCTAARTL